MQLILTEITAMLFLGVIVEFRSKNFRSLGVICEWSTNNPDERVVLDPQDRKKSIAIKYPAVTQKWIESRGR